MWRDSRTTTSSSRNMMKKSDIEQLERQGCFCLDWSQVEIAEENDLRKIRNVYFSGRVSIGTNVEIINVPGGISGVRIGDNVRILNVARIECTQDASFGVGTEISVLDETGKRPVVIYPGLSAQIAFISSRMPEYAEEKLFPMIRHHIYSLPDMPEIGDGAVLVDCGTISDVRVWPEVKVEGALHLHNGCIVNNSENGKSIAYVGPGVNAENFIIEDGIVSGGCLIRNTYVGQGTILDKGFTSHDSLFFANCTMENGEACAVLAGPFTVSMHKSSLLIGCQTSFMNTGSGTNMSNHMYKTGPEHWGVLERGVKTSSNSYIMHGSHIGAYSLVMGDHKKHPDTSDFPFSYLFGDEKGNTTVVPGAMLGSYGLKRDIDKWPKRDRRAGHGLRLHDRICYGMLTPYTVDKIMKAILIIRTLHPEQEDATGLLTYKGLNFKKSYLAKGMASYVTAICKYLKMRGCVHTDSPSDHSMDENWIDVLGLITPQSRLRTILKRQSIADIEKGFDEIMANYSLDESAYISALKINLNLSDEEIEASTTEFDSHVEADREASLKQLSAETEMFSLL